MGARGGPPPIDLALLEAELDGFLRRAASADFLERLAPAGSRRIVDVAFSGNGEPTSAPEFDAALAIVETALARAGLLDSVKIRLITNGSGEVVGIEYTKQGNTVRLPHPLEPQPFPRCTHSP